MGITLKFKQNDKGELEHTFMSFKSKYQTPLLMIIKEYWYNNEVVWAEVLYSTRW
jgi:hypothetical protein